MTRLSNDLTWAIMGKNNAYLFKTKSSKITLSKEKGNVLAVPKQKYSTSMTKSVGIVDDGKGNSTLLISTKNAGSNPSKAFHNVKLNTFGRGSKKTTETVKKLLVGQEYRPDLARATIAHMNASAKAGHRKSVGVAYVPKNRSSKN